MKKVLALVLAAVMSLGMATTAFAAVPTGDWAKGDYEISGINFAEANAFLPDDGKVKTTHADLENVTPGDTLYFPVTMAKSADDDQVPTLLDSGASYYKLSDANDFRISYSINDGKNMIKSIKFASMKDTSSDKGLYIAIETNDNFIMDDTDVDVDIKVSAKNGSSIDGDSQNNNKEYNFKATMTYGKDEDIDNGFHTVGDNKILTFAEDADDVTLCFDEDVEVWGNMKGQKDILVRLSTENDAIEDKYPDATIRFFDSTKDTFRRAVTVTIPYEASVETPYLYVVDAKGNLTKLAGGSNADKAATETDVKYDDVAGAFVFKTTTLNNYVISDTELKNVANDNTDVDAPAEGDKPTDGTEPNPGTGANDFVGLAVALAVVSVAGIAVAKRK